jgi:hypothetical protein
MLRPISLYDFGNYEYNVLEFVLYFWSHVDHWDLDIEIHM